MRPTTAIVTLLLIACGLHIGCNGQPSQPSAPAEKQEQPVPAFKPDTDKILAMAHAPAIAAVRCREVSIQNDGTRSRAAVILADVIVPGTGSPGSGDWKLVWYTQTQPDLAAGRVYLVAAEAEGQTWTLIEACPLEETGATRAVEAAAARLAQLRPPAR